MSEQTIMQQMLIIGRSYSRCGNCGKGAFPEDKRHTRLAGIGYRMPNPVEKPCGIEWKYLASDFADVKSGFEERVKNMRPDLQWIGVVG